MWVDHSKRKFSLVLEMTPIWFAKGRNGGRTCSNMSSCLRRVSIQTRAFARLREACFLALASLIAKFLEQALPEASACADATLGAFVISTVAQEAKVRVASPKILSEAEEFIIE
jgi:hypothetical protein